MNKGPIKIEWFMGAETNLCYNAVDRHVKNGLGGKVAFLYEGVHIELDSPVPLFLSCQEDTSP